MIGRRQYTQPVAPVAFPPELRAQLFRPGWSMADRFKREAIFARYSPKMAIALARDHVAVAGLENRAYYEPPSPGKSADQGRWRNSWADAYYHTRNQDRLLRKANVLKAFDEDAIRTHADNYARLCSQMATRAGREGFTKSNGVEPPAAKESERAACARMDDPQWWRKQLRVVWRRHAENEMRAMGMVRRGGQTYVSDYAVTAIREQRQRGQDFLDRYGVVNEHGEQLSLKSIAEHSLANPALRRGEFMVRLKGFEKLATLTDCAAEFVTLTAPSRFHAQHHRGGMNQRWHDAGRPTVRDAQDWLNKMWGRTRSELSRRGVARYGFRIAEPHHDGTPHWHMLLFVPVAQIETLRQVISEQWLSEYGDEPGAEQKRVEFKAIDVTQGSAVGYLAKYISKNIDGAGTIGEAEDNETGAPVSEGIVRVLAWASIHGIRQFQQIGGPAVGLWRELFRLREALREKALEPIRKAVSEEKHWDQFCLHLGGGAYDQAQFDLTRCTRRVGSVVQKYSRTITRRPSVPAFRLAKVQWKKKYGPRLASMRRPAKNSEFPAVWLDKTEPRQVDHAERIVLSMTKYGEFPKPGPVGVAANAPPVAGLMGGFHSVRTRLHMWRQQKLGTVNRSGVMNPPRSAARGREAGNPIALNAAGDTWGTPAPAGRYPGAESGGARPASLGSSFFRSASGSASELGPVGITVRESNFVPNPAYAWIATVPLRPSKSETPLTSGAARKTGPPE